MAERLEPKIIRHEAQTGFLENWSSLMMSGATAQTLDQTDIQWNTVQPNIASFGSYDSPTSHLSQGNLDLKRSTARQTGPWWIIPKGSVQVTSPELMTARTCQISGSEKKAEVSKLHKILRKTTNVSDLRSKNWPNSPTRVQELDAPSSGFPTCANTC
jgi:hypothetical protein